jgi:tetratricopeptide (TPR) repeat protein
MNELHRSPPDSVQIRHGNTGHAQIPSPNILPFRTGTAVGMNYFSRKNTAGAFSSDGYRYQDHCALLKAVQSLQDNEFESIGIETEDDFCLLFHHQRINVQVKDSELSSALIKAHVAENQLLIGSGIKKEVETFLAYLTQYRNAQASGETPERKRQIDADFAVVVKKLDLPDIPASWSLQHVPRAGLYENIAHNIHRIANSRRQLVNADECISKLLSLFANARSERNYFDKKQLLAVISGFTADVHIIESHFSSFEVPMAQKVLNSVGGAAPQLLDKIAEKIIHAEILQKKGDLREALKIYTSLSEFIETDEIFLACAMLHDMLDDTPAARESAGRALDCNRRSFGAHFILATLACATGDKREGLNHFEAAYAINPSDPALLYNLGVFWQKEDLPKATDFYKRSLALNNDNSSAHLNCGISLFLSGDCKNALDHINQALLLDPGAADALSQKGEILRFLGDHSDAAGLFERALSSDGDNVISLVGLAYCYLAEGDVSGVGLLIDHHEEKLRNLNVGQALEISVPGGNSTSLIAIERSTDRKLKFCYNDLNTMVSWPNNDLVILGTLPLPTDQLMPQIIKVYETREHYLEALLMIASGPEDEDIGLTHGKIRVLPDHCLITLQISALTIFGKTPRINGGLESFQDNYHDNFLLILANRETREHFHLNLQGIEFS